MATEKKQSFLGGAAVLAFGIVAVKIIGAVFKIPLRNILGEGGSADFSNAYNIYATLLTVSTAGLPVALSKLVSESYALGRTRQAHPPSAFRSRSFSCWVSPRSRSCGGAATCSRTF